MDVNELLACPGCGESILLFNDGDYECTSCGARYTSRNGVQVFLRPDSKINIDENDRAEFWNASWENRNSHLLSEDREFILKERQRYLDNLTRAGYPSIVGITSDTIGGKTFLNIGCGGGYEGLLFAGFGARYIGVDFTHNAARFTKTFIDKANFEGITYQAEAEGLPFQNDSIDFVYSTGVLHHTPNIEQALKEAFRVLKPGGTAKIGLYATYSVMFMWYRLHAILQCNLTKNTIDKWMNANTEGSWQTENRKNHWTKTYTKAQFTAMLNGAGFADVKMVQSPLQIKIIPIIGKIVTALLPRAIGDIRIGPMGGMLVATCHKK